MSGPKVVRIVTREEILAICEAHLQRLATAFERWQTQAGRIGELSEADRAAAVARHARLCALLQQDQLRELQKAVPIEIDFLERDLEEREERAIIRATQKRQQQRRVHENAATLLKALQAKPGLATRELQQEISELAQGASREDADALLAKGFALLATAPGQETLGAGQHALAQQLKSDAPAPSLADWINSQPLDSSRDVRLLRIDRHIAELQLLQGVQAAEPFVLRLEKAEAESRPQTHNLLLDSLVLDLAHATRLYQQQRAHFNQLQDLASEVAAFQDTAHQSLLEQVAGCEANQDLQQLSGLIEQCKAAISTHLQAQAAIARRQAVLQGLASLGYETREGMETAWAQAGRVVLRKTATPGFGVEVGGKADTGRLQVRAVAMSHDRDKTRDRDIETIWCGEFQRLQALLKSQGDELIIEQALEVGQVELKVVATGEQEAIEAARTTQRTLG
ncbi:hypothetical protein [Pseudomonas vanderleydeniana]|uniref:Uncharacterized protein n=1 Tax=Pseudomonas vanderleydeniana TaxID=2745495 RepID=A0A9E6PS87_9PSED|nr:hypothetical protein [Pseudomonas vanderleydeniana]QXI31270.1 hypothetical protein HU752_015640 [Pseudomonas vanderleydeniana]